MSSDEEVDYMSDKFLDKCLPKDIRPGLTFSHSQQVSNSIQSKKKELDKVNKQRFRPHRVVEAERRDAGLGEALSTDNKGFALMQKMGYKPGCGIGKEGAGRAEPVPIQIKSGRGGLGREAALQRIAEEKAAIRKRMAEQRAQWSNTEDYRARVMKKLSDRHLQKDLRASQVVCERLDSERGFAEAAEVWFWPPKETEPTEDEEESSTLEKEIKEEEDAEDENECEFEPSEQLEMLTTYLRNTHVYCIWCGVQYEDDKDLKEECPGATRKCHD